MKNYSIKGLMKKIAIFGGSFNPPGIHHIEIVKNLSRYFDEVIVVPCGTRPDKPGVGAIPAIHRIKMAEMAFGNMPKVRLDCLDLEKNIYRRTHELQSFYEDEGEIWHVVGGDIIAGGGRGESLIQKIWERGIKMWNELNFAVLPREGIQFDDCDLPPKNKLYYVRRQGSSSKIRKKISAGESIKGLVLKKIENYIIENKLYVSSGG